MADIARIKRNIQKMADGGASDQEIGEYAKLERVTPEEIRGEPKKKQSFWGEVQQTVGQGLARTKYRLTGPEARESLRVKAPKGFPVIQGPQMVMDTLSGMANTATMGIPHQVIKQQTGVEIPKGNVVGNIAGMVSGPAGAAADLLTRNIKSRTLQGLVGGATYGAMSPIETLNVKRELIRSGLTAAQTGLLGAAGGAVVGGAEKAYKAYQAHKLLKTVKMAKINEPLTKEAARPAELAKRSGQAADRSRREVSKIKETFAKKNKQLAYDINKQASETAVDIQPKITKQFRDFKTSWGNEFDDMVIKAGKKGKGGITPAELKQIENETIAELESMGVEVTGTQVATIRNSISKYFKTVAPSKLLDASGRPLAQGATTQATTKIIPFKEVVDIRRGVGKALSSQAKSGKGYTSEDISAAIFNNKLAARLEESITGMKGMNAEYHEFLNMAKQAYTKFKPSAGQYATKSGEELLKRVAKGAEGAEKRLIQTIEDGGGRMKGIGKVTGEMKRTAEQIAKNTEASKQLVLKKIEAYKKIKTGLLKRQEAAKLSKLKTKISYDTQIVDLNEKIAAANLLKALGKHAGTAITYSTIYYLLQKAGLFESKSYGGGGE